jgi:hypothetical protein
VGRSQRDRLPDHAGGYRRHALRLRLACGVVLPGEGGVGGTGDGDLEASGDGPPAGRFKAIPLTHSCQWHSFLLRRVTLGFFFKMPLRRAFSYFQLSRRSASRFFERLRQAVF